MRPSIRTCLAALPLALMFALSGCGGSEEPATPKAAGQGGGTGGQNEKAVQYAQCMRENGVDMPDPEPGGGVTLKLDGSIPKETVDKAQEACRKYNPMADGAAGSDPKAEAKAREFAECMRKNGVEDFPDPEPGQRGVRMTKGMQDDPDFEDAQKECRGIFSSGPGGGGAAGGR